MLALHKPDGSFDGTVAIALDVHWIDYMMRAANLPKGAVVAVYDRSGKVIATNDKDVGAAIAKCGAGGGRSRRCRQRAWTPAASCGASAMPR